MKKEKVFIVVSHKHNLKGGKNPTGEWEVAESVEFVNQLRPKHYTMSSAIGDYINRKMITGKRFGMDDFTKFENYVRTKYEKEITELDNAYSEQRVSAPPVVVSNEIEDEFGNIRERNIFDKVPQ